MTQAVPSVRSAAFGIWVNVGSRHETEQQAGSAHYLEHLLFKGTTRRSALDISSAIDTVGGELNAFTSKEHTCFYSRVLDRDLPLAVDVITDVVTAATLRTADINSERTVVLEEIAMRDDDPGDVAHEELFTQIYGPGHPMGRSILGSRETIESITPAAIRSFYARNYVPGQLVVAAAGNLDHADVVRRVRQAFAGADGVAPKHRTGRPGLPGIGGSMRLQRATEQANIIIGYPGLTFRDDRKWALAVLNSALGGGMSSRLFTEVRERRGLVYAVYSFVSSFSDSGMLGVYAGTSPARADAVLEVVAEVVAAVAADGITDDELHRAKGQVRGSTVLGLEDTFSRMSRIGRTELTNRPLHSVASVLDSIDAVTNADVQSLAQELLTAAPTTVMVGPKQSARRASARAAAARMR